MDQVLEDVLARARERAPDWFPELDVRSVEHAATSVRPWTRLHRLTVAGAGGTAGLLAKEYRDRPLEDAERPRLGTADDRAGKHALEFAGLRAAERAVTVPGTFTVRALDHLPEHRTLVLEEVAAVELRERVLRSLRPGEEPVDREVEAAARWLAAYHAGEGPPDVVRATPGEVEEAVAGYGVFLADRLGGVLGPQVAALVVATRRRSAALPARLPVGTAHGDAAARNVLVDGTGRVAMIDPLGRRRAPVLEDVATFTVTLRTSPAVALASLRRAAGRRVDRYADLFTTAYADASSVQLAPLPVCEALVVLDRLAAAVSRDVPSWRRTVELVPLLAEVRRLRARMAVA